MMAVVRQCHSHHPHSSPCYSGSSNSNSEITSVEQATILTSINNNNNNQQVSNLHSTSSLHNIIQNNNLSNNNIEQNNQPSELSVDIYCFNNNYKIDPLTSHQFTPNHQHYQQKEYCSSSSAATVSSYSSYCSSSIKSKAFEENCDGECLYEHHHNNNNLEFSSSSPINNTRPSIMMKNYNINTTNNNCTMMGHNILSTKTIIGSSSRTTTHTTINETTHTTTTTSEKNSIFNKKHFVNYYHFKNHQYSKEQHCNNSSSISNISSSSTTNNNIYGRVYSPMGRTILIFTFLMIVYYLLIMSTILNIITTPSNTLTTVLPRNNHYHSFLLVNGELFTETSPYPVTCRPYPPCIQFQLSSAGLPTSGALANGTFLTVPSSSSFVGMYIVTEPWLVVFPSLSTSRSSKKKIIGRNNGNNNNNGSNNGNNNGNNGNNNGNNGNNNGNNGNNGSNNGNNNGNGNNGNNGGNNSNDPPRTIAEDDTIRVRRVTSSYTHTIVIGDENQSTKYLFGFGLNDNNSLGLSTELNQSVMVDPNDGDNDILDLDMTSMLSVPDLVKKDVRKRPNKIPRTAPAPDFNDIEDVFAGDGFTVVLTKSEKQLYTIGRNNRNQLGVESKANTWTQLPFRNVSLIDTGSDHTALIHNGYIGVFFGSNFRKQMGNITLRHLMSSQSLPVIRTNVPIPFDFRNSQIISAIGSPKPKKDINIISIQLSRHFTLMLTDEGSLVYFGELENAFKDPDILWNSTFLDAISFGGVPLSFNNIGSFKSGFKNIKNDAMFEATVSGYHLDGLYFSSGISKILACDRFFVVLLNNNTLWFSDNSFRGVPGLGPLIDPIISQKQIAKMVCGRRHLVLLMQDSTVYTIGSNYYGQIGLRGVSYSIKLNLIRSGAVDIEAGDFTTFIIGNQSRLYAFGMNNMGQLGVTTGSTSSKRSELAFIEQDSFAVVDFSSHENYSISSGPYQTFIMSFNGTLAAGLNYNNMFGIDGSPEKIYSPIYIQTLKSNVRTICATLQNTFAITNSTNELIMLGQSGYITQVTLPRPVSDLSCGAYHILVTDDENNLYAAGYNGNGQLGVGNEVNRPELFKVNWDTKTNGIVRRISCGAKHSLVLTDKGAFSFGDNIYGQLGIPGVERSSTPLRIPIDNPVGVYAGFYHSHVITKNGTVLSFGRNDYQQLGPISGSALFLSTPTAVNIPYEEGGIVDIKPGAFHSLMLTATGTVYAYGNNDYGQLGFALEKTVTSAQLRFGTPYSPRIALSIAAGAFHSLILTSPYVQDVCPSISCSGMARSSVGVCSSNGTCSANELCLCNYGYSGNNCQYYSCFGASADDPKVCSGRGNCLGIDSCSCFSNATGANCQTTVMNETDLALSIALPLGLSFLMLLILGFIFLAVSLTLFFRKEKKKKLEERETSSGTESVNNNNKSDLESNLSLSVDKTFELNLVGTPVSGSDPSSNKSGNIRTFLNISQVSTAVTLTKSMMDENFGNNLQLSNNSSQNRLNGGESMLIERFVNLMKIGEGSFGLVFKGQDSKQNFQWKAIKLIRFSDLNELNQTLREATHLLRMVHPHIVRVNDVFIDANQHMLCMEMDYYELGDFEQFINNQCYLGQTVLSESIVSQIIYQICSALDYMNSEYNMIHRDIKPSNIFIKSFDYHRSHIHIVLGDFGLAKKGRNSVTGALTNVNNTQVSDSSDISLSQELMTGGDANTLLSTQMGFAGTPIYMSWEAIVQGKNCFQTDIFALGVTAYQCLTGDRRTCITQLYLKEHQRRQVNLHLMSSEKDVEDLVRENIISCSPNCSIELVDLIMQMLKKNPEDRPKPNDIINSSYFVNKEM